MQKLLKSLSSPRNLIVFDSAARLGSFTKAAQELNMQQPSVSAAIKQLEEALSVQLFYREHRKVQLTIAGERLYAGVSRSLAEIERSIEAVQQIEQGKQITINSSSAFSYYWMIPRLSEFHQLHPTIDLRMQTSDREPDLDVENIDLGIRIGDGNWAGCQSAKLAKEIIYPVASPTVMAQAEGLKSIQDLQTQDLIHLEEPIRERPTWQQWFSFHGVPYTDARTGLRLNDYALVLQAALSGEGFAFGWDHTVRNLINQNLLVAREDWAWETGRGVYLVWSKDRPLSDQANAVRDWIISSAKFTART